MFTASDTSVQGSVAAGFEKVTKKGGNLDKIQKSSNFSS